MNIEKILFINVRYYLSYEFNGRVQITYLDMFSLPKDNFTFRIKTFIITTKIDSLWQLWSLFLSLIFIIKLNRNILAYILLQCNVIDYRTTYPIPYTWFHHNTTAIRILITAPFVLLYVYFNSVLLSSRLLA